MKMNKKLFSALLGAALVACIGVPMAFATGDEAEEQLEINDVMAADAGEDAQVAAASEVDQPKVKAAAGPQVGDKIWIKSGSVVYKDYKNPSTQYKLRLNYKIIVTEVILDESGEPAWYKFDFAGLGDLLLRGYKYVAVEDTSKNEPEEDQPVQDEEFKNYIDHVGSTSDGVSVAVSAPEGAFSDGVNMAVSDSFISVEEVDDAVTTAVEGNILGIKAVDISFGEQPAEPVAVKMSIPGSEIPEDANLVVMVHMGSNGPEVVGSSYLNTETADQVVSFVADGFSSYAAVFVNEKYVSQKMSDALTGNSRYSIVPFNVDLFDYDPQVINDALNNAAADGNGFHFTGYEIDGCSSNNGINNSEATFAKQGILEDSLTAAGLPEFQYLAGDGAGVNTGKILFSDSEYQDAKTTYNDIPFEFVYDGDTGYYEYKSSANHAQLNEDGSKIELYADTLSTRNSYVATLDLSTATGYSDMTGVSATKSSFVATAGDFNVGSNNRLDPYVSFTVNNVAASSVGQIYVKAKIPASVGSNIFKIYFTNDTGEASEDRIFTQSYTANGDWIEFVIDTSEVAGSESWNGTIKALRIDLFDAGHGTLDATASYPIEISQISLIQKDVDDYVTRGGFYPFSEIQDSYPGNNTAFDLGVWADFMQKDGIATSRASRSIYNPTPNPASDLYDELAYGMAMEFDFYIPVDRPTEDLTYYFNGDDDLWVFVDDKLVLDIGGGHGAITGTANFTTGAVSVEKAVTVTGYNSGAVSANAKKTESKMDTSLYSPGRHTMKIFYLERGGSVSNCFMKFNLPQTPQGSVSVSKEVVETSGASLSELKKEEFQFNIQTKDQGSGSTGESAPLSDVEFDIVNASGDVIGSGKTDSNGSFALKHGQTALFYVNENHEVTVTETEKNNIDGYEYKGTTVNGQDGLICKQTTQNGKLSSFEFVNEYTEKKVKFTYIPVNPEGCPDVKKGTVELTGAPQSATFSIDGVSEILGKCTGDPTGSTAKVSADKAAVKFVGWYSNPECTVKVSDDPAFNPQKENGSSVWIQDEYVYYAKFEYMYGKLKISKTGIEAVDHDAGNAPEELQSTVFHVSGTSYSGVSIDMDVVVTGNSSKVIGRLPVGEYVVTEKTDWSWRYEPADQVIEKTVHADKTAEAAFSNTRDQKKWLNGDNIRTNVFESLN